MIEDPSEEFALVRGTVIVQLAKQEKAIPERTITNIRGEQQLQYY